MTSSATTIKSLCATQILVTVLSSVAGPSVISYLQKSLREPFTSPSCLSSYLSSYLASQLCLDPSIAVSLLSNSNWPPLVSEAIPSLIHNDSLWLVSRGQIQSTQVMSQISIALFVALNVTLSLFCSSNTRKKKSKQSTLLQQCFRKG